MHLEYDASKNRGLHTLTRVAYALDVSAVVFAHAWATGTVPPIALSTVLPDRILPLDAERAAQRMGLVAHRARRARQIVIHDLAETTRIHRSYISAIENGRIENPGLHTIDRLGRGLAPEASATLLTIFVAAYAGEVDPSAVRLPSPFQ